MKIEVFPGSIRKAKEKAHRPAWFVRFIAQNGNNTFRASEGYYKLASAVNAVESHLAELEARFGTNVTVLDKDGKPKKTFVFVHAHETEHAGKKPYAYHYRRYGKLVPV